MADSFKTLPDSTFDDEKTFTALTQATKSITHPTIKVAEVSVLAVSIGG